jgi:hypothetical protein
MPKKPLMSTRRHPGSACVRHEPQLLGGQFKAEPIPKTLPKFKLGPIPTTWQGFKLVPVTENKK